VYTYTWSFTYLHTCPYTYSHLHLNISTRLLCGQNRAQIHVYIHICTNEYTFIHTYVYIQTYKHGSLSVSNSGPLCGQRCAYMRAYSHTYINVYMCTYVFVHKNTAATQTQHRTTLWPKSCLVQLAKSPFANQFRMSIQYRSDYNTIIEMITLVCTSTTLDVLYMCIGLYVYIHICMCTHINLYMYICIGYVFVCAVSVSVTSHGPSSDGHSIYVPVVTVHLPNPLSCWKTRSRDFGILLVLRTKWKEEKKELFYYIQKSAWCKCVVSLVLCCGSIFRLQFKVESIFTVDMYIFKVDINIITVHNLYIHLYIQYTCINIHGRFMYICSQ